MRRKERALVIIQRASAIAAVAVFVLWVAGLWWEARWLPPRGIAVTLSKGGLGVWFYPDVSLWHVSPDFRPGVQALMVRDADLPLCWWFYVNSDPMLWGVFVPLWALEVPTLGLAAALWRRNTTAARRVKAGQCAKCGYDRTGLAPEHPCPECGAATPNR